jgi:hypothetical protein
LRVRTKVPGVYHQLVPPDILEQYTMTPDCEPQQT